MGSFNNPAATTIKLAEKFYLINLARRQDRLQQFEEEMKKGFPFDPPELFVAVDGMKTGVPQGWEIGEGAYGCFRSHHRILEDCIMNGINSVMIFEDDACIYPKFAQHLNLFLKHLPDDWEGIYLGGQHIESPQQVNNYVDRCVNVQRTHAYILRGKFLKALYHLWSKPSHCQHIDVVSWEVQQKCKVYAPKPFLVGQRSSYSDILNATKCENFWSCPRIDDPVIVLKNASPDVVEKLRQKGLHTGTIARIEFGLDKCIELIQCECTGNKKICTIWYPGVSIKEVQKIKPHAVEVDASSFELAMSQIPEAYFNY